MLSFLKKLFGSEPIPWEELKKQKAIVLDVRTPAEFKAGHVKGAINIPLDKLPQNIKKVQRYGKPIVTCCASGRRSEIAAKYLKQAGVTAWNGGPWTQVRNHLRTS